MEEEETIILLLPLLYFLYRYIAIHIDVPLHCPPT